MTYECHYRDHKYEVGRIILGLRTRTKLTQGQLAKLLGVSVRSIQNWEAGENYPKDDRLRSLIGTFLKLGVFWKGQEREEALKLWEQVNQDAPQKIGTFDEIWFNNLLAQIEPVGAVDSDVLNFPTASAGHDSGFTPQQDWDEAPDVQGFVGREEEQTAIMNWVLEERCNLLALLGIGGIGKTSLAVAIAWRMAPEFDFVIFRSLRNAPSLDQTLNSLLEFLSHGTPFEYLTSQAEKINQLINLMRHKRCLIILDNLETIMQEGLEAGQYREGYSNYGILFERLVETTHQSCLLLTSREKPFQLGMWEGRKGPVRVLALSGLTFPACEALLADAGIRGDTGDWQRLVQRYDGHPLALKLISEPIRELFDGSIHAFLTYSNLIYGGLRNLIAQHYKRLSEIELNLLFQLAQVQIPIGVMKLQEECNQQIKPNKILEALEALRRRYLIERAEGTQVFTLHPVMKEYTLNYLMAS